MVLLLRDLFWYAFRVLKERRLRTLLTVVGVSIGPLALVMMVSVVSGYSLYVVNELSSLGQNLILVYGSSDYVFSQRDLDFIKSLDGVLVVEPFYMVSGVVDSVFSEKHVSIYAVDMDALFKAFPKLRVVKGYPPSDHEISYALIGYWVSHDMLSGREVYSVGDVLRITITRVYGPGIYEVRRVYVRISGVLGEYGGTIVLSPDNTVFLPLDSGRRLLGLDRWTGILVITSSPSYVEPLILKLREAYKGAATVVSFREIARVVSRIAASINFIVFATSLSAFAVATVGIAATMITSVIERTREIGILKALGFTDHQIMALILSEGVVMAGIGCILGILLGIMGAYIMASHGLAIHSPVEIAIKTQPHITPDLILKVAAITIGIGLTGSMFPAYKASKLPPAQALKYE